jgi:hypothetical protein
MRRDEGWRDIPVIVVTAKDLTRAEVDQLKGHVINILQKGVYQRSDLLAEIHNMVAQRVALSADAGGRRSGGD